MVINGFFSPTWFKEIGRIFGMKRNLNETYHLMVIASDLWLTMWRQQ